MRTRKMKRTKLPATRKEDPLSSRTNNAREGVITGLKVRLRRKALGDARNDYAWQTDPEITRLDAAPLLNISFAHYILDYTSQMRARALTSYRFGIDTIDEGRHIGNCSYYNINEFRGEAEIGIVIGNRDYWNRGYGTDAVNALLNHLFGEGKYLRIYLKTLDWNARAQKCFRKCGFTPCGNLYRNGYSFIIMEQYHGQWQQRQQER